MTRRPRFWLLYYSLALSLSLSFSLSVSLSLVALVCRSFANKERKKACCDLGYGTVAFQEMCARWLASVDLYLSYFLCLDL